MAARPDPAKTLGRRLRLSLRRRSPTGHGDPTGVLDPIAAREARAALRTWPEYEPSPLVALPDLADRLGVDAVWCKDESGRFGIGSFKALGGALATQYALQDEIERRTGERPTADALRRGHAEAAVITTTTASAGNHGRSVAWGSERFGCGCVIFLPEDADPARADAIAGHGARVERFPGGYDDAVAHAARVADERGWIVVSDTAYPGYEETPRRIMQGYTLLAAELLEDLRAEREPPLTHLLVQAGVGGLATGVCGHLALELGRAAPRFIAVEPWRADCFGRSLRADAARTAPGPFGTKMGGLAAGVASTLAWDALADLLHGAVAIPEEAWVEGMAALASGELGVPIDAGPSGASGVGALLSLSRLHDAARLLGIDPGSRIGVLVTEKRFGDPRR